MSAPANSQGTAIRPEYHWIRPKFGAIDKGVSSGETYSLMTDSQAEFCT
jgi:hypothetical protein